MDDRTNAWRAAALVSALPGGTIGGILLGVGLDHVLGTGWLATAVLGALGFAAGVFQLFRGLKPPDEEPKPPAKPPPR
jgi:F0F1-type ATP synthase assembly protein I